MKQEVAGAGGGGGGVGGGGVVRGGGLRAALNACNFSLHFSLL